MSAKWLSLECLNRWNAFIYQTLRLCNDYFATINRRKTKKLKEKKAKINYCKKKKTNAPTHSKRTTDLEFKPNAVLAFKRRRFSVLGTTEAQAPISSNFSCTFPIGNSAVASTLLSYWILNSTHNLRDHFSKQTDRIEWPKSNQHKLPQTLSQKKINHFDSPTEFVDVKCWVICEIENYTNFKARLEWKFQLNFAWLFARPLLMQHTIFFCFLVLI